VSVSVTTILLKGWLPIAKRVITHPHKHKSNAFPLIQQFACTCVPGYLLVCLGISRLEHFPSLCLSDVKAKKSTLLFVVSAVLSACHDSKLYL